MSVSSAASSSCTIFSVSALACGPNASLTNAWPSASPRSLSVYWTQRFQRGRSSFAPVSAVP